MTLICLIRHGETDWNKVGKIQGRTNIPLNESGIEQAKKCAAILEKSKWDMLLTSPLLRAKQTAELMNKHTQLPLMEMDAFTERDYGDAEGMTPEVRNRLFSNRAYPNMETREELLERIGDGLRHIEDTYPDKKILLVTHGGVINTILAHLSDGEIGSGKTKLNNACVSHIYLQAGIWRIKNFNLVDHLE